MPQKTRPSHTPLPPLDATALRLPFARLSLPALLAIGLLLILAALPFDRAIAAWAIHGHPLPAGTDLARELMMLEQYGQVVASILIIAAVALLDPRGGRRACAIAVGCLAAVAACYLLKASFGRARPRTLLHPDPYHLFGPTLGFTHGSHYQSFPSGHVSGAIALSVGLAAAFPRGAILFYLLALQVMLQRVLHADHYLSDVFGGALLATVMVRLSIAGRWADHLIARLPPGWQRCITTPPPPDYSTP